MLDYRPSRTSTSRLTSIERYCRPLESVEFDAPSKKLQPVELSGITIELVRTSRRRLSATSNVQVNNASRPADPLASSWQTNACAERSAHESEP